MHPNLSILKRPVFAALLATSTVGCMMGPDYTRPEIEVPTNWNAAHEQVPQIDSAQIANLNWWEQFEDPELSRLVRLAVEENKDLKIATARIDQFFALYGVSRAELFPRVDLDAGFTRYSSSENLDLPFTQPQRNNFSIGPSLTWEVDFWGRIRRQNEAAWAELMAQESGRRAVILTLVSSVASAYLDLRQLDRQLEISLQTLKSRQESLTLAENRFNGGLVSELDVAQAKAELAITEVTIPQFEQQIALKENEISFLLGQNPGAIVRGRSIQSFALNADIPPGIPSEILENRPDVTRAEQDLISANASIGSAKAELFPRIGLTAFFGYESTELKDLFKSPSENWNFGPQLRLPIFNSGELLDRVAATEARRDEALYNYQRTIQQAFREVEDTLVSHRKTREKREINVRLVAAYDRYLNLAQARYDEGQTAYIEVLDAQRNLFTSELNLAQAQAEYLRSIVGIYGALGGGWIVEAEKFAPQSQAISEIKS